MQGFCSRIQNASAAHLCSVDAWCNLHEFALLSGGQAIYVTLEKTVAQSPLAIFLDAVAKCWLAELVGRCEYKISGCSFTTSY